MASTYSTVFTEKSSTKVDQPLRVLDRLPRGGLKPMIDVFGRKCNGDVPEQGIEDRFLTGPTVNDVSAYSFLRRKSTTSVANVQG